MRTALLWWASVAAACGALPASAAPVVVDDYVRRAEFNELTLSPTGEFLAMTLPLEGATAAAILRSDSMEMVGNFRPRRTPTPLPSTG